MNRDPRPRARADAGIGAFAARLCGYDSSLTDQLRELVEGLADLVADLAATDGGEAWLRRHPARLEAGEESEAA